MMRNTAGALIIVRPLYYTKLFRGQEESTHSTGCPIRAGVTIRMKQEPRLRVIVLDRIKKNVIPAKAGLRLAAKYACKEAA